MVLHPQWKTALLQLIGHPVRFTGWPIWNQTHAGQVGKMFVTSWELHPVTSIEVQVNGAWRTLDAL